MLVFRCLSSSEAALALGTRPPCLQWLGVEVGEQGVGHFSQCFRHGGTKPWMNKPRLTLYPRNKKAHLYSQRGRNLHLIDCHPWGAGICVVWECGY